MSTASATKRNYLSSITKAAKNKPSAVLLYTPAGWGKTSLAAHIPGVVFITDCLEDGITTLKANGLVPDVPQMEPAESFAMALEQIECLASGAHEYKALCIDSLSGIQEMLFNATDLRSFGGERAESVKYKNQGAKAAVPEWIKLLNALDRLRNEKGMSIFLTGHSKLISKRNPDGADYDTYTVDLEEEIRAVTIRWCDYILFGNRHVEIVNANKAGTKGKATGGKQRIIYTDEGATYLAKNRANLPEEIDCGSSGKEAWDNFTAAMKAARKATQGSN
jgi:hypothetical protein